MPAPPAAEPVLIFVLDSPINVDFIEGRVLGMRAADVTHGSLVGRVLRSYCRAPLVSVPVEELDGGVSKRAYLEGLRSAILEVRQRPQLKVLVNISLASASPDAEEEAIIRRLVGAGALVVAAAGNDDSDAPVYPAAYPGVIAVASGTARGKALGSNFGPHVDIAASGDITFIDYEFLPYQWLRREMEARGTSFAAPRVTATIAYLLAADTSLSPRQAYEIVRDTARPIDDDYFRRGLLGAGLLDVHRAKSAVAPLYRFVHFVLPVCIWIVLGVLCAYLCLRYGSVGVFLTLMIWLLGLPASVLLVIKLGDYLDFVGGGSVVIGLGATGILAAALAVAAALQQWQVGKAAACLLPPFGAYLVLGSLGLAVRGGPIAGALAAAAAGMVAVLVLELATRRKLAVIAAFPAAPGAADPSQWLLKAHGRALDRRIRMAVIDALGRVADGPAVTFLLERAKDRDAAVRSLARVADEDVGALAPWVQRFGSLDEGERARLLEALEMGCGPEAIPYLVEARELDASGRIGSLIDSLRRSGGSPPAEQEREQERK